MVGNLLKHDRSVLRMMAMYERARVLARNWRVRGRMCPSCLPISTSTCPFMNSLVSPTLGCSHLGRLLSLPLANTLILLHIYAPTCVSRHPPVSPRAISYGRPHMGNVRAHIHIRLPCSYQVYVWCLLPYTRIHPRTYPCMYSLRLYTPAFACCTCIRFL